MGEQRWWECSPPRKCGLGSNPGIETIRGLLFAQRGFSLQCAKKVVSDSPGLVDFAIGLVNSVSFNLPDRQVKFFKEFKLQKNCEINLLIKTFLGLVEIMFGLVNINFSLPEWQAEEMTFFAPCSRCSGFPFSSKTNISRLQFNQEWQTKNQNVDVLPLNRYLFSMVRLNLRKAYLALLSY